MNAMGIQRIDTLSYEEELIGGILIDRQGKGDVNAEVFSSVRPDMFYSEVLKKTFKCCLELWKTGGDMFLFSMEHEFEKQGWSDDYRDNSPYLIELVKNRTSNARTPFVAKHLIKCAQLNQALTAFDEAKELILTEKSPEVAAESVSRVLKGLEFNSGDIEPESLADIAKDWIERKDREQSDPGRYLMPETGIVGVDAALGKPNRNDLITIAGQPGMGKTQLALTIANAYSFSQNKPVLIFSMEMSSHQIFERIAGMRGHISVASLQDGSVLDGNDSGKLAIAIQEMQHANFHVISVGSLNIQQVISISKRYLQRFPGCAGIFVDYLQKMSFAKAERRDIAIGEVTGTLKAFSMDYNVPTFLLSQLNRNVAGRTDKRPINQDLKESSAIEQDSDRIIFPYREFEASGKNPDNPMGDVAEIICGKNRHDEPKVGLTRFVHGSFVDLADDNERARYGEIRIQLVDGGGKIRQEPVRRGRGGDDAF